MKTSLTAIALVLAVAAPSFAATTDQLRANVENSVQRIDSSIVLPDLDNKELAFLKGVVEATDDSNSEKAAKVRFYISDL